MSTANADQPIARIACYNDLVAALRIRKEQLGLSDAMLDEVAGLASGHTGKILGPSRDRGIGSATLETLMMALAFDFIMVNSPTKLAEMRRHYQPRHQSRVRNNQRVGKEALSRVMRELGNMRASQMLASGLLASFASAGGKARQTKLSKQQRRKLAQLAAQTRWNRQKVGTQSQAKSTTS